MDLAISPLESYRTQLGLGVVLQESFLLDGTIRENVPFSHPDVTEQEILEEARLPVSTSCGPSGRSSTISMEKFWEEAR